MSFFFLIFFIVLYCSIVSTIMVNKDECYVCCKQQRAMVNLFILTSILFICVVSVNGQIAGMHLNLLSGCSSVYLLHRYFLFLFYYRCVFSF